MGNCDRERFISPYTSFFGGKLIQGKIDKGTQYDYFAAKMYAFIGEDSKDESLADDGEFIEKCIQKLIENYCDDENTDENLNLFWNNSDKRWIDNDAKERHSDKPSANKSSESSNSTNGRRLIERLQREE